MNIILTDEQREKYKGVVDEMFALCPDMMSRKFPRANVQQAFVLDMVRKHSNKSTKILAVGSYEDTASESLIKLGYNVTAIDPAVNMDLNKFFNLTSEKFEVIMSTSVIEHVQDDELFIEQICKLLSPNGKAILTCDFDNNYVSGGPKPGEDYRLYTKNDLWVRLNNVLIKNNCNLDGEIDYDHEPDFQYGVYKYSFATFMFKKNK